MTPIDDGFGNWLAGFVDGEGCFSVSINNFGRPYCEFAILVRLDDAAIIREIHDRTGLGKLYIRPARITGGRPQITWKVRKANELCYLVDLLEKYPLRAKKARDFVIWAAAVRDLASHRLRSGPHRVRPEGDTEYVARMRVYRDKLRAVKVYDLKAGDKSQ